MVVFASFFQSNKTMEMIQAVTPIIINGLSFGVLLAICAASKIMGLSFYLWLIGDKLSSKF
jgi:hypothetical protein